jgi:hypothetical protein
MVKREATRATRTSTANREPHGKEEEEEEGYEEDGICKWRGASSSVASDAGCCPKGSETTSIKIKNKML